MLDPFSEEYAESMYHQRAEMYADSFFDYEDEDAPSEVFAHEQGFNNYAEFAEYERQMNLLPF